MRLIDADELIYILKKKKSFGELTAKEAIRTVKEQPTIIKWIPVSERLPEDRNEKLVYLTSGRISIAKYNDHILPNSGKCIGWGYDVNHPMDFELEEVIAWMPLPEPYKAETDV